jgi:hypothetical protein
MGGVHLIEEWNNPAAGQLIFTYHVRIDHERTNPAARHG